MSAFGRRMSLPPPTMLDQVRAQCQRVVDLPAGDVAQQPPPHREVGVAEVPGHGHGQVRGEPVGPADEAVRRSRVLVAHALGEGVSDGDVAAPPARLALPGGRGGHVRLQSIGSAPCSRSRSLARLNGRDPKNPRAAPTAARGARSRSAGRRRGRARASARRAPTGWRPAGRPLDQGGDGPAGDGLPALAAVAGRGAGADGEHPVQQQHPLVGPRRQVAVGRRRQAQVGAQLLVDVLQAARHGSHVGGDREGQADRVPGGGVGVLAHDEHPHRVQRLAERPQHLLAGRQVAAAGGHLRAQEVAHPGHVGLDRAQRLRPGGVDEVGQGAGGRHAGHSIERRAGAPGRPGAAVDSRPCMASMTTRKRSARPSCGTPRSGSDSTRCRWTAPARRRSWTPSPGRHHHPRRDGRPGRAEAVRGAAGAGLHLDRPPPLPVLHPVRADRGQRRCSTSSSAPRRSTAARGWRAPARSTPRTRRCAGSPTWPACRRRPAGSSCPAARSATCRRWSPARHAARVRHAEAGGRGPRPRRSPAPVQAHSSIKQRLRRHGRRLRRRSRSTSAAG